MTRQSTRRSLVFGVVVLALVAAVAVAATAHLWLTGPLYRIGDVRAAVGLSEPLDPPAQDSRNAFRVAPNVRLYAFAETAPSPPATGEREDILVIHGGPGLPPARPWRGGGLLPPSYRLVYYHQRGCGLSTRPIDRLDTDDFARNVQALNRELGLATQVADIERIRRILGRDTLAIVGHGFGAFIAALYAAEFPERVRALVLIAPADLVQMPSPREDLLQLVSRRLPPGDAAAFAEWQRGLFDFSRVFAQSDAELAAHYARFGEFWARAGGRLPASDAQAAGGGWLPVALFLSTQQRHDWSDALRRVSAPVVVLHGSEDLLPPAASAAFAAYFPNGRLTIVPGAGHFLYDDAPEAFAAAVVSALQ